MCSYFIIYKKQAFQNRSHQVAQVVGRCIFQQILWFLIGFPRGVISRSVVTSVLSGFEHNKSLEIKCQILLTYFLSNKEERMTLTLNGITKETEKGAHKWKNVSFVCFFVVFFFWNETRETEKWT